VAEHLSPLKVASMRILGRHFRLAIEAGDIFVPDTTLEVMVSLLLL
jgi:hypothetical protein